MDEKILSLLKDNRQHYISGEELCQRLGVSRTAIWKHMQKLKDLGYGIDAIPHLGYRLSSIPDKLLADEILYKLKTNIIGKSIYSYATTASTNDIAWNMAAQGTAEGTIVLAEEQTKGRGRMGRTWSSPKGEGIYMSVILRPDIRPVDAPQITLMAAVSIAQMLQKELSIDAQIKWPNDILIRNKKVCGILTEMSAELDAIHFIILGIGINVNTPQTHLSQNATSLGREKNLTLSRIELCRAMIMELDKKYQFILKNKFDHIIKLWRDFSLTLGQHVQVVNSQQKTIEGQAIDIDEHGALILRKDSGFMEHIFCGDVVSVR